MAWLLASIGIYGVLAYLTGQREPEFGVRMAVAQPLATLCGCCCQCLQMVLPGLVLGVLAALAAGRIFQGLVQGTQLAHAETFATMIPLLLGAALLASFVPARRASRVDPVSALRQE